VETECREDSCLAGCCLEWCALQALLTPFKATARFISAKQLPRLSCACQQPPEPLDDPQTK